MPAGWRGRNMRKVLNLVIVGLLGAGPLVGSMSAQSPKLGFVNTLEVLYGTEEGKIEIEKLNQFAAQKQQEITDSSAELEKLQGQYATQQRTLNPETRARMERDIQDRDLQLKRIQEDVQLDYNKIRDELLGRMSEKIQVIINEYAPENGYGAIFLRNETQTFVALSLDITQEIIKIYNEKHPVVAQ